MSFLKSLFGGRKPAEEKPAGPVKSIEHNGFTIHATPYQEGGQYQRLLIAIVVFCTRSEMSFIFDFR